MCVGIWFVFVHDVCWVINNIGDCWRNENGALVEKTEVLREKPVPLSLCPPPIPCRLPWDQNQASTERNSDYLAEPWSPSVWNTVRSDKVVWYTPSTLEMSAEKHVGLCSCILFNKNWITLSDFCSALNSWTFVLCSLSYYMKMDRQDVADLFCMFSLQIPQNLVSCERCDLL